MTAWWRGLLARLRAPPEDRRDAFNPFGAVAEPPARAAVHPDDPVGRMFAAVQPASPSAKKVSLSHDPARIDLTRKGARKAGIDQIIVNEDARGKKHGTAILRKLVGLADKFGVVLELGVLPQSQTQAMTATLLSEWYARNGFRPAGGNRMVRSLPKAVVRSRVAIRKACAHRRRWGSNGRKP